MVGEVADDPQNSREEALDGVVLEEHVASPELGDDAPERPEVNLLVVGQAEHDLGRAVGPRLHVGREVVIYETGGAEVNDLHLASAIRADEDVLGLEVAVYQPQGVHVVQRREHLVRYLLQPPKGEVRLIAALAVELRELVEVVPKQLRDDDEMFFVIEVVIQTEHAVLVNVPVHINVLQQLDLVERLVKKVLVVLDDLHANHLVVLQVQALDCAREGRGPQILEDLVPRGDDGVHLDGELL
mmetsp:Transcript_5455/g.16157  ORF Transcript_5455/g.16157 Transcript_5455/m.16157 type:complete len:242 (-) Transcript_5455:140-865(-)